MKISFRPRQFIISITVLALLIFLHWTKILLPLEKAFGRTMHPLQNFLYRTNIRFNRQVALFSEKNDETETELLKARIRTLTMQNARLKIIDEENRILKKELKFIKKHSFEAVAARVIGFDAASRSDLLILEIEDNTDIGEIDYDMPAISDDGVLAGKIAAIKDGRIYLRPVTSPQSAVAAMVLNKNYTVGTAEGELGLGIKMKMIPLSESLKQGDLITTSGLEEKMPRGLLIGTVIKVARDPQNPFNIAYVDPMLDIKNLSNLLIIKKY